MNNENLRPQNTRTKSEQREIARKGGIASGEARRKKKTMQELAKMIAAAPVNKNNQKKLKEIGIVEEDATNDALVMSALFYRCLEGDTKAIEMWEKYTSEEADNLVEEIRELFKNVGGVI